MTDARDAARAIDALRRGWPVRIAGDDGALAVLAIETADAARLAAFDPRGTADLLLSPQRAATLKLANQRDAAMPDVPVTLARVPWLDLDAATALADPALDLQTPLKGPFVTRATTAVAVAQAALRLARLAGLLPAFFVAADGDVAASASVAGIAAYDSPHRLAIASRARLPVAGAEQAEIVAFRGMDDAVEHVALLIGAPDGNPPLIRLHSECLTGDALGSLKCDCGPQLDAAIERIRGAGWGILLYLRQEGRGIGLINKLRAYALQDQGFDTVDANLRLGFATDERDFGVAARMLALLGQDRVRLLSNNPAKAKALEANGIAVIERVPHRMPANRHGRGPRAARAARQSAQCRLSGHQARPHRAPAVSDIVVDAATGWLSGCGERMPCRIGRGGPIAAADKREGDGATPLGRWLIRGALFRRDRVAPTMPIALPWRWLRPADGWSDDPADPAYNRPVRHPHPHSAERLWLDQESYDLILVLGHNDAPPVAGQGSAIFLHCTDVSPHTEGCVAISKPALARLLPRLRPGDAVDIR